jgi:hypothetical protein
VIEVAAANSRPRFQHDHGPPSRPDRGRRGQAREARADDGHVIDDRLPPPSSPRRSRSHRGITDRAARREARTTGEQLAAADVARQCPATAWGT